MDIDDDDDDDEQLTGLTPEEQANVYQLMKDIEGLASKVREPMDPKLELTLELACALLNEQLQLDKRYMWVDEAPEEDKPPSGEAGLMLSDDELKEMMGE